MRLLNGKQIHTVTTVRGGVTEPLWQNKLQYRICTTLYTTGILNTY